MSSSETLICPKCHSNSVAGIIHGTPLRNADGSLDDNLQEMIDSGEVVLGNAVFGADSPAWHCNDCGHEWS